MTELKKMPPEVLIYLQSLRKFFKTHDEAPKYFGFEGNEGMEEKFFEYIGEMSFQNFEEDGEPQLTVFQLEEIRRKISAPNEKTIEVTGVLISLGNFGTMSLN